jgi:hypothetical protein
LHIRKETLGMRILYPSPLPVNQRIRQFLISIKFKIRGKTSCRWALGLFGVSSATGWNRGFQLVFCKKG